MLSTQSLVLALATSAFASPTPALQARDTWGGSVSLGPTKSNIISATTTLIPGLPPTTQTGMLFLWPGMSNGTGDLIQTTLEQWPDNSWCGATKQQWCVRASLFGSFGQLDGTAGVVSANDQVKIVYTRGAVVPGGWTWTQNVTNAVTGKTLSSFAHMSGPMTGWGTGTECNGGCAGTISAQKYTNTVITLEKADTTFGSTIAKAAGATYSGLASSQGGKVWTITTINVPAMK
ncbi:hypothetical protein K505DRAFT_399626 [Melanomma pulvis-pyrius CBS 109.77]|uniref:Concanavalin A-like lectin/glucanase n=1 Tax=Melanomma pulvis-pyrius CBS 109.77 TaxID=1314802 RepID=A0A6A6WQ66_9PLEO|nr:hypothetical protein K505DRAFT_399626 [Melanomma pulvis-pyrius CBS 109.77]